MTIRAAIFALAASLLVSALWGCRPQPSPAETLNQAVHGFHGHLVFDRFDQAGLFVPGHQREEFVSFYEDQRDELEIAEYEISRLEIAPDQNSARAEIILSWYEVPSGVLHTSRMVERWTYYDEPGTWEVTHQEIVEVDGEPVEPPDDEGETMPDRTAME